MSEVRKGLVREDAEIKRLEALIYQKFEEKDDQLEAKIRKYTDKLEADMLALMEQ